ncbi:Eco57I restriction-modification methylase domain-containing protein [Aeoliella mucimassa]|uniref:site-specific DNA-methyltransferase (adenine-specific) n=1 Tax=Aeoliella mucimassa TaxID=2527972 RepID=A0A518APT0_9BACT|nr:N-6 DNA methylase [Aeoliella mucimassa]QDU56727.1 N-6 DNA Methylase [Aeoliella mucimassa]
MAKRNQQFQTIRTEGAILPPDILRLVASLKVDGATPDAYHLPPGSKLNEAISQSWTSLLNHWQAFQEAREDLPESDETGTSVTNQRWLLPLFNELDYGRLVTTASPEIEERVYPIERFYNHTPIHLIGCKLPLDRRTRGARGAATASPHSMVQEFLNRSEEHLWAFLSNGLQLRILRDNISLSRQAFVEFDLEAMMEGEVYADFALLWLLCHQSRVESDKATDCWLEKWSHLAREQGTRVLNDLRVGVQKAIEALGRGFIGHPRNDRLREKLRTGSLSTDDYYRQLLRTVYRLLFLFVAEDRELLHPPDADPAACNLYDTHYSTRRLRELAHKIRGSKHADLWHSLSLVFDALGRNEGCPQLGLCGLGSFLWRSSTTADIRGPQNHANENSEADAEPALISNDDLLQAVRALAYVEQDRVLRVVDYRNLGSEELGSVYESLLELHPVMNAEAKAFDLSTAAGNERKTTGSYYTPDSLVQCLLDSALDPVVEDRLKGKKGEAAEQAILELKVCDPACGSGHFLIAAAHRLARHLARVRTGETEPSPDDYQHALRDVIGRCVYGVDINPMAVELCKVSLWMEAIEPGKPLSFLDHHIQCGNSLLGTTPALLTEGILDDAFKPIDGDVKECCAELKKENKRERKDYKEGLRDFAVAFNLGNLLSVLSQIDTCDDNSIEDITAKQRRYEEFVRSADYLNARLLADLWCSVFVWKKDKSDLGKLCPTERDFRRAQANPHSLLASVRDEVQRLADQYQFIHWHLAFPDVFVLPSNAAKAENEQTGWSRGFDVVLGNPPWEMVEVESLKEEESDGEDMVEAKARIERIRCTHGTQKFTSESSRYPFTSGGRKNLYALFVELASTVTADSGRVGQVAPTGVIQEDPAEKLARHLFSSQAVASIYEFQNKRSAPYEGKWFEDVHPQYRICLLTLARKSERTRFVFDLSDLSELRDPIRQYSQTYEEIDSFCAGKFKVPMFRNSREANVCSIAYHNGEVLGRLSQGNQPKLRSGLIFNFGRKEKAEKVAFADTDLGFVQVYEGEYLHQYNHRFSTSNGESSERTSNAELENPQFKIATKDALPRQFTKERLEYVAKRNVDWIVCLRRQARSTDSFISISTVIPPVAVEGSLTAFFEQPANARIAGSLAANLNSFVANFILSLRQSGPNVNKGVYEQLPLSSHFETHESLASWCQLTALEWFTPRVLELTYTAWDLEAFAWDCGYDGPPFRWDEQRRFLLRCELDAAYFHLYLGTTDEWGVDNPELREMFPTPRDAVDYIMETFPIVKRKDIARTADADGGDNAAQGGRYITKETILDIYDEMAEAIRTGQPYKTRLDPPPGPPTDAEGNFIPMAEWDENNWPSHIHQPRESAVVLPVAASATRLERGRAVLDILLLLEAWGTTVSTSALEPALVLMRNDVARTTLASQGAAFAPTDALSEEPQFVRGLDLIYQGMETNGAIRRVGQSGFELADSQLLADAPAADRARAAETLQAIQTLSDLRTLPQVVASITNERFDVTV